MVDHTHIVVDGFKHLTPLIQSVFAAIKESIAAEHTPVDTMEPEKVADLVTQLLCGLGARGILTLLGVRKTIGSKDKMIPEAEELIRGFNKPFSRNAGRSQVQFISKVGGDEEESKLRITGNPCQLSVGARALMKHAHRSSEVREGGKKVGLLGPDEGDGAREERGCSQDHKANNGGVHMDKRPLAAARRAHR